VGKHTLSVSFIPENETNYGAAQATVPLTVGKATPAIAWSNPEAMSYGSRLSDAQLNASASVPGTFAYNPSVGSMLSAGEHSPVVLFTPNDSANYDTAQAAVKITVAKAAPAIAWPTPDPIPSGTPLSTAQLNATASVPGTFVYAPALGDKLEAGNHTLSVTFTPADSINMTPARATVPLTITEKAATRVAWTAPAVVSYGTQLSATQLNATASVPGTLVYAPGAGDVLPPGRHTLAVLFTPADAATYAASQATVTLVVEEIQNVASLLASASKTPVQPSAVSHAAPAKAASAHTEQHAANGAAPVQKTQRETRSYKGAIYEKGDDGQWHLQQN
jgi:hypothetical protein